MDRQLKRILGAFLIVALLCGVNASAFAADERHTFSWWLGAVEDAAYYGSYDNNPTVMYFESLPWPSDTGEDTHLDLTFTVPGTAAAQDNCSLLLSTDSYTDLMQISYYSGSVAELYEEGIILDLTPYVEQYMPNYRAFLDKHPELAKTATTVINGEKKYLQLYTYKTALPDQWEGPIYRRDWIIKYGSNPHNGETFSGSYTQYNEDGTPNTDSWEDNVVFPSGETYPKYISDWEWMFKIFTIAMEDLGITDGYCVSLPYAGYAETGDWVSSFGGGGAHWYMNEDSIEFGLTGENFRAYMQCMNTWYQNEWLDPSFAEHSGDIFYQIDDTKVRQGKVGAWIGMIGTLMNRLDVSASGIAPATEGIMAFAAPYPINDMYGEESAQNREPYCFFQIGVEDFATVITRKAQDKDLTALFAMLDWQYSFDGNLVHQFGLNAEQIAASGSDAYTRYGIDTAYTDTGTTDEQGRKVFHINTVLTLDNGTLWNAMRPNHLFGLGGDPEGYRFIDTTKTEQYNEQLAYWAMYTNTGRFRSSFEDQLSPEDAASVTKINLNVRTYAAKNVPKFISGKLDPFSDTDWESFVKALNKYRIQKGTDIYQALLDSMK